MDEFLRQMVEALNAAGIEASVDDTGWRRKLTVVGCSFDVHSGRRPTTVYFLGSRYTGGRSGVYDVQRAATALFAQLPALLERKKREKQIQESIKTVQSIVGHTGHKDYRFQVYEVSGNPDIRLAANGDGMHLMWCTLDEEDMRAVIEILKGFPSASEMRKKAAEDLARWEEQKERDRKLAEADENPQEGDE